MFKFFKNRKKKKQAEETIQQLAQVIDCSEEAFRQFLDKQNKGYIMSLHNILVITFNRTQSTKDELVSQISLGNIENKNNVLEGMYSELMKIEQKVFIVKDYLKNKYNVVM